MSFWAEDPELFLHKGQDGVVHVLRCKKETATLSSSSMLMKPEDFTEEGAVTDLQSLTGGCYEWDKNKYEALIDYIYSKHLMVNCQGCLIVELAISDQKEAPPIVFNFFHKKRKAAAATAPLQLIYIRALDILDMGSYGPHGIDQAVPARTVKYLQNGAVVQTKRNPKEIKLTEELALKCREVETLQQELLQAKDKTEIEALIKRVVLEELAKHNNCGGTTAVAPPRSVRIYTKADTSYSLTIRNGDQVILRPNDESDVCQYWVKDIKYGAIVKDAWGFPCYALVNKFTGQALKPSITAKQHVELVPYNPNVLDKSILWSEVELGDGYKAIRKATDVNLNLDAFTRDGVAVGDGTIVGIWNWLGGNNQRWNIAQLPIVNCSQSCINKAADSL